jgi:digeranylgeranylglycerophospholipid reductase
MSKKKVLVVGAGPIGCYTARLLAERNCDLDVGIIEEHSGIGRPVHCAGLVGQNVFSEMKIDFPQQNGVMLNGIDGAEVFFDGESFKIKREGVAVVIDRERFDRHLGEGLQVDFNTRFVGVENEGRGYLVETDRKEYYADIVIGSDGANSALRKMGGFRERIEYMRGVQFRMEYNACARNFVQIHLKNPFFAWVIPENEKIVRVGIISDNPYHDLTEFLKERNIEGRILEKFAGLVPFGSCGTQNGNLVLVGDAACQVKPLTQGGIYYGMRCAEILTDCISENRVKDYEHECVRRFGKEMEIGLKVRQIYQDLHPGDTKKLFTILRDNSEIIEEFGDFENHSRVLSLIIKDSRLQMLLGKVLFGLLKDIFI